MPKTLVVDDDPAVEALFRDSIEMSPGPAGHHFLFARSDAEALDILGREKDLDIAVVAIDSGGLSGMGLFHQLGDVTVRVPRIALTASHDLSTIRRAMNEGAADFLTKPISAEDLTITIDKVFEDCQRRRQAWRTESQLAAIRREVDIASEIQQRILPSNFPGSGDLDIFARMTPATRMGGDFYDFFEVGDDHVGIVVADVSGKGVPAAFFMAVARTLIRATAQPGVSPGACLAQVNALLCRHDIPGMFVSVFYGILNTGSWEMTFANGGHLPPYLVRNAHERVLPVEGGDGVVLGVQEGLPYDEASIALDPGDALFFYTDGLTEAFDAERNQFSDERLIAYLLENRSLSAHALVDNVFAFVDTFTGGAPQSDDITSLVIKRFR